LRENTPNNIEKTRKPTAYFRGNPVAGFSYRVLFSRYFPGLPRNCAEISVASLKFFSAIARNNSMDSAPLNRLQNEPK